MDVKEWLDQTVAPLVRADGGWLELREQSGDRIILTAKGECAHCRALDRCLNWIESRARSDLGHEIMISAVRDPFLWRK